MKRITNFKRFALILFCLISAYTYGQTERPEYVPGQVLVKMKANKTSAQKNILRNEMKATFQRTRPNNRIEVWQTDKSNIEQLVSQYRDHPDIELIEPNYYYYLATENCTEADGQEDITPGDALFIDLWGMNNTGQNGGTPNADIDASEGWDIATGSPSVVVGLIDTGVDWKHPDLVNNIWQNLAEDADGDGRVLEQNANGVWIFDPGDINGIDEDGNGYADDFIGWDFIDNDNDPFDIVGHGTHVAGTLGAEGNNGIGVAGVTWDVQIAALRVFRQQRTSVDAIAEALDYAVAMNMPISNNSYAEGRYAKTMISSLKVAQTNGHLFVAAAGNFANNNDANPNYPSSYDFDNIISVAATDPNDLLWVHSANRGSSYGATNVDIAAPGAFIRSTTPMNTYNYNTGTSMATPHITGACALLWHQNPTRPYTEIKTAVLNSVDVLPDLIGTSVSEGRLNLHGALTYFNITPSPTGCRFNDSLALVALYDSTNGANWTNTWDLNLPMDGWYGVELNGDGCVSCIDMDGDFDCTINQNTSGNNLLGTLPSELGSLSNLTFIDLSFNEITGSIPSELGNLSNLKYLNIENNELTGNIPSELNNLNNLTHLILDWNNITGNIPSSIGNLNNLSVLDISRNDLIGNISPELANLSNLSVLNLSSNDLTGDIPLELVSLSNLSVLNLSGNDLTGDIPPELVSLSNLNVLNLSDNDLTGDIPPELVSLSNLSVLDLYNNDLTGNIPSYLGSLSNLTYLSLSYNSLNGGIPPELGNLINLTYLNLSNCGLNGGIPPELGNLINLEDLILSNNQIIGTIPSSIWNLTKLHYFGLGYNQLSGIIPPDIGNLTKLNVIYFRNNAFNGNIPSEIGSLPRLYSLNLKNNNFTGNIPQELGDINFSILRLSYNNLSGCYHPNLMNLYDMSNIEISNGNNFDASWGDFMDYGTGACSNPYQNCRYNDSLTLITLYDATNGTSWYDTWDLSQPINTWEGVELNGFGCVVKLYLEINNLTGSIPPELGNLSNLKVLNLRYNNLTGSIPPELGNLSNLKDLNFRFNNLSGEIPPEFGNLEKLIRLYLGANDIVGSIPVELSNLNNLRELWLSGNELSGTILPEFGNLQKLWRLRLANNQLSGCYDQNLLNLCNRLSNNGYISNGNNFTTPWEDFCNTGAGICQSVWPGDYNYDGTTNETDALYWGLAFGNTGAIRPNASTAWQGQGAPDWATDVEGINSKHQDGDGSGTVDGLDLQVVDDNFGNIHAFTQSVFIASTMIYELVEAGPVGGDPSYDLYVTDANDNNISAHGLAGVIDFGDVSIDDIILRVNNSSLVPSDTLKAFDEVENRFHFALTRTDKTNQLCDGSVASIIVVTENIQSGDFLELSIESGNTIQANGDMARVAGTTLYSNYPSNIASNDLTVSASVMHEQCNVSGSVTLFVEGGTLPYTYVWNTGATSSSITGLTPNIYEVTVTDAANMSQTLSVEVQGQYIAIPDESGNLPDCTNSPCPTLLTPGGNVLTGTYKADTAVNSDGTVNGNVEFKAGEMIILREGFEIPPNTNFSGTIEDCDGN